MGHDVSPLTVITKPTPRLAAPHYRTMGSYPQVTRHGLDVRRVNRAIGSVVVSEQRRYAQVAINEEAQAPDSVRLGYKGLFATFVSRKLLSASTEVVSALIPLYEIYPGGSDGGSWLSVTVRVPSGSMVGLDDLFSEPTRALPVLARAVRQRMLASNSCVRDSLKKERIYSGLRTYEKGFAPTEANYRHFALIPSGLAIGFPVEQVASAVCNVVEATVSYTALDPYWSPLGTKLIGAVRGTE